jgi:endonuclease/exonuclease/phosphatase (EEP) superfamily protein YafD
MTFNTGFSNDFENIFELILFEKPEVVQFQEVSLQMQNKLKSLKSLFPYNTGLDRSLEYLSSIVLSKYPLKDIKIVDNYTVLTKVLLDKTELTIIGIHLSAPLNHQLLNLYADLYFKYSTADKPRPLPQLGLDIAMKQMEYLKTLVDNTNQNLILMGDLNMTTTSKRFTNFLKDTNLYTYASYKHPTFTWPAFMPDYLGIQIDHVLFSENFKVIKKKTTNHFGSDHRPLIVDLAF